MSYQRIVTAICEELQRSNAAALDRLDAPGNEARATDMAAVAREILERQRVMPDYLRLPMQALTRSFDYWSLVRTGTRFQNLPPEQRAEQLSVWKESGLEACRSFVRFYESLFYLIVLREESE
jgi:hypothetical protein